MNSKQIQEELRVIPINDTVIFPQMKSKIRVDENFGEELSEMVDNDQQFFIALTVKEKNDEKLNSKSFYSVGNLVHIESIQKSDDGKIVYIKSLKRIKQKNLRIIDNTIKSNYTFLPITRDMDDAGRKYIDSHSVDLDT